MLVFHKVAFPQQDRGLKSIENTYILVQQIFYADLSHENGLLPILSSESLFTYLVGLLLMISTQVIKVTF